MASRGYPREAQADGSVKITPPDGKPFTLFFAPETGLPHKLVATVPGLGGEDAVLQETTFTDYKPFDGIQKATRVSSTRNGQLFIEQVISEFTIIEQPDRRRFQF